MDNIQFHDFQKTPIIFSGITFRKPASVAQSAGRPTGDQEVRQHSFVEIDQEIHCIVILSLRLIQEVSGKRMYSNTG